MFTAAPRTWVEFQLLIGKLRFALAFTASKAEPEGERERAMGRAQQWYFLCSCDMVMVALTIIHQIKTQQHLLKILRGDLHRGVGKE